MKGYTWDSIVDTHLPFKIFQSFSQQTKRGEFIIHVSWTIVKCFTYFIVLTWVRAGKCDFGSWNEMETFYFILGQNVGLSTLKQVKNKFNIMYCVAESVISLVWTWYNECKNLAVWFGYTGKADYIHTYPSLSQVGFSNCVSVR